MVIVEILNSKAQRHKANTIRVARILLRELAREKKAKPSDFHIEIFLVGSETMYKNVLSFPHPAGFPRPDIKQIPLGEIYLNPEYIKDHGENFAHMLIHGFLHLLGYDHIKKSDRIVMERKEKKLLSLITNI